MRAHRSGRGPKLLMPTRGLYGGLPDAKLTIRATFDTLHVPCCVVPELGVLVPCLFSSEASSSCRCQPSL
jgi:hypothetical protein